jgi:hypothetical protein
METENKQTKKNIGGLWIKKSKDQKTSYLNGKISLPDGQELSVVIFKNTYKTEPNQPDYRVFPNEPKDGAKPAAKPKPAPAAISVDTDDEIPF